MWPSVLLSDATKIRALVDSSTRTVFVLFKISGLDEEVQKSNLSICDEPLLIMNATPLQCIFANLSENSVEFRIAAISSCRDNFSFRNWSPINNIAHDQAWPPRFLGWWRVSIKQKGEGKQTNRREVRLRRFRAIFCSIFIARQGFSQVKLDFRIFS